VQLLDPPKTGSAGEPAPPSVPGLSDPGSVEVATGAEVDWQKESPRLVTTDEHAPTVGEHLVTGIEIGPRSEEKMLTVVEQPPTVCAPDRPGK
jgi:hypothetical protein